MEKFVALIMLIALVITKQVEIVLQVFKSTKQIILTLCLTYLVSTKTASKLYSLSSLTHCQILQQTQVILTVEIQRLKMHTRLVLLTPLISLKT